MNPGISIVIRTFNSARTLPRVLNRLKLQPGDELIIVDSGSMDATLEIAQQHQARVIIEKPFHYSRALNVGFRAATQPWVLVMSSHCLPLTEDLIGAFRSAAASFSSEVAVAYGVCCLVDRPATADETLIFATHDSSPAQRRSVYGGNSLALYRRSCWEKLAFDEMVPTAEDLMWFTQVLAKGSVVALIPAARVLNRNQSNLRHMFRKGWLESRMARKIAGAPDMTLLQLGINWGALMKKCALGRIPFNTLVCQGAHALGCFLSSRGKPL